MVSRVITGLKRLVDPEVHAAIKDYNLDRQVGKRFGDKDAGTQLGHYIIVSDKRKGVEPGFVATKAWTSKDADNMVENDSHKFSVKANAYLEKQLGHEILAGKGPLLDQLNQLSANEQDEAGARWRSSSIQTHRPRRAFSRTMPSPATRPNS